MTDVAQAGDRWLYRIGKHAGLFLIAMLSVAVSGCYDMTTKVTFKTDGKSQVDVDFSFPPEAKDIIAFYDSIIQLQPESAALFGGGLCKSVEMFATLNPTGPMELKSEQVTTPEKLSCLVSAPLGSNADAADKLVMFFGAAPQGPGSSKVIEIEQAGERRLRITIDFNRGVDAGEVLRTTMLGVRAASGRQPDEAAVDRVVTAYGPFMVATGKMMGEKRSFTFVIDGVKVIETNGEKSDGSVRFRWSWADFLQRVTKAQGIENKVYYAVIEY